MRIPFMVTSMLLASAAVAATTDVSTRIKYDSQCLTIDGRDVLIFSGAFHCFRCPKELWRDRFTKIKEAGFNTVETYVAWNWHEPQMPGDVNDFSKVDLAELKEWMRMAHEEFGLYTIIRPGPYICAEWAGGGYPAWLLTKRPADVPADKAWLRSDDPTYLAWSKHWYDAVCPVIAAEQITRKPVGKPGVILFQIENEYDLFGDVTPSQRIAHLKALHRDARANGIDVPIFTCWTKQCRNSSDPELKDVFDGPNFYPRWGMDSVVQRIEQVRREQPNAPVMIPECQGGWFAQVGGMLSEDQEGIDAAQINHLTLLALARDTRILNYYMLFGGTNFGDWAARGDTTSYDYNAPIREPGGVGERYLAVKAIGQMLREHGEELARAAHVQAEISGAERGVDIRVSRAKSGAFFVFCRNSTTSAKHGEAKVSLDGGVAIAVPYELEGHGFKVLYLPANQTDASKGEWLPKSLPAIDRPEAPKGVRITTASKRNDALPDDSSVQWSDVGPEDSLIRRGIYDSRFVLYRTTPTLSDEQAKSLDAIWLDMFQQDAAVLNVNGHIVHPRGTHHGHPMFPAAGLLHSGENRIVALYENRGWGNFGRPSLESVAGLRSGLLTSTKLMGMPVQEWRVKMIEQGGDAKALVGSDLADADWPHFTLDALMTERLGQPLQPGSEAPQDKAARVLFDRRRIAVFRADMEVSDADIQSRRTRLNFDKIDDVGTIFVNGQEVGQSKSYSKPAAFDVARALKAGRNVIAVIVDNSGGGQGGMLAPVHLEGEKLEGADLHWQLASDLPGCAAQWWASATPTDGWQTIELDTEKGIDRKGGTSITPASTADSLVTWYRMEFELAAAPKNIWVPWRAALDASGNGFVYLNGHALGRLWEVGPQREFYLPECWLKFGTGEKNVLVICLRSTERGSQLRAAEIAPYADQAERR